MSGETLRFAMTLMMGLGRLILPVAVIVVPFSMTRRRYL